MSEDDLKALSTKLSRERLMKDIHETGEWGKGERWGDRPTDVGMSRLALTPSDKQARDWFASTTRSLGCEVHVDEMGNQFAIRKGKGRSEASDGPATFAGSHLDTQPSGGRYDGILGVCAGVEMLRVLEEEKVETKGPVGVVNWTNEEGARFPISMTSSLVWAGLLPLSRAHSLLEVTPPRTATLKSAVESIDYLGSIPCSHKSMPMAAHFELHIEQGPILEREQRRVGIVKGVQAYRWFTVDVKGRDSHTGTTPFESRADALLLTSKLILHAHRVATRYAALCSTGILILTPGSTNTVPGDVRFSLDIRATEDEVVDIVEAELRKDFEAINNYTEPHTSAFGTSVNAATTKSLPCEITWTQDFKSPATHFHPTAINCVSQACSSLFGAETEQLTKEMVSGAGHDSVPVSTVCPTSMIFVPCRDGVSHNPREYCEEESCADGGRVLLGSVVRFDRQIEL